MDPAILSQSPATAPAVVPAERCRVFHRRVPLPEGSDAAEIHANLASTLGGPGAALLESGDNESGRELRSILVPRPALRLVLHRGELRLRALDPRFRHLRSAFRERMGSCAAPHEGSTDPVSIPCPPPAVDNEACDQTRRRSNASFAGPRALLSLLEDVGPAPLPIALIGPIAFDLCDRLDTLPPPPHAAEEPDFELVLATDLLEVDHRRREVTIVTRALCRPGALGAEEERAARERLSLMEEAVHRASGPAPSLREPRPLDPARLHCDLDAGRYRDGVRLLREAIRAGEAFQVVLSRTLTIRSQATPFEVYRRLKRLNPSPYMFYLGLEDGCFLGASPESCVEVRGDRVTVTPIAGTVPRGRTARGEPCPEADRRQEMRLRLDEKELAEHAMLVDLARNDVARISRPGTRQVSRLLEICRLSHVQHLVSRVEGRLAEGLDAFDAYAACANMGTLTGAPKLRATELLRDVEGSARGYYGGAVIFATATGDLRSCIAIRSLRYRDGRYCLRAGAGIVADSQPESELAETRQKAQAALKALALAEEDRR